MSYIESLESFAGPVDIVIVEFPAGVPGDEGFAALDKRVYDGVIAVLDVEILVKNSGVVTRAELASFADAKHPALQHLAQFESDILDADDFKVVGEEIEEGSFALVLVYEDRAILSAFSAWDGVGAKLAFLGAVNEEALTESFKSTVE